MDRSGLSTNKKFLLCRNMQGPILKKIVKKKCRLTPKRSCTRFWLKMSKNAKKSTFLSTFWNFFLQFWSVWRALSICKDSFWIWIGLRKKVVQKCQNWEKMFLWSNRPLTWSGVVMVHFYVKTLSQLVRGGRGWSFSGYLKKSKKIDFMVKSTTWVIMG